MSKHRVARFADFFPQPNTKYTINSLGNTISSLMSLYNLILPDPVHFAVSQVVLSRRFQNILEQWEFVMSDPGGGYSGKPGNYFIKSAAQTGLDRALIQRNAQDNLLNAFGSPSDPGVIWKVEPAVDALGFQFTDPTSTNVFLHVTDNTVNKPGEAGILVYGTLSDSNKSDGTQGFSIAELN